MAKGFTFMAILLVLLGSSSAQFLQTTTFNDTVCSNSSFVSASLVANSNCVPSACQANGTSSTSSQCAAQPILPTNNVISIFISSNVLACNGTQEYLYVAPNACVYFKDFYKTFYCNASSVVMKIFSSTGCNTATFTSILMPNNTCSDGSVITCGYVPPAPYYPSPPPTSPPLNPTYSSSEIFSDPACTQLLNRELEPFPSTAQCASLNASCLAVGSGFFGKQYCVSTPSTLSGNFASMLTFPVNDTSCNSIAGLYSYFATDSCTPYFGTTSSLLKVNCSTGTFQFYWCDTTCKNCVLNQTIPVGCNGGAEFSCGYIAPPNLSTSPQPTLSPPTFPPGLYSQQLTYSDSACTNLVAIALTSLAGKDITFCSTQQGVGNCTVNSSGFGSTKILCPVQNPQIPSAFQAQVSEYSNSTCTDSWTSNVYAIPDTCLQNGNNSVRVVCNTTSFSLYFCDPACNACVFGGSFPVNSCVPSINATSTLYSCGSPIQPPTAPPSPSTSPSSPPTSPPPTFPPGFYEQQLTYSDSACTTLVLIALTPLAGKDITFCSTKPGVGNCIVNSSGFGSTKTLCPVQNPQIPSVFQAQVSEYSNSTCTDSWTSNVYVIPDTCLHNGNNSLRVVCNSTSFGLYFCDPTCNSCSFGGLTPVNNCVPSINATSTLHSCGPPIQPPTVPPTPSTPSLPPQLFLQLGYFSDPECRTIYLATLTPIQNTSVCSGFSTSCLPSPHGYTKYDCGIQSAVLPVGSYGKVSTFMSGTLCGGPPTLITYYKDNSCLHSTNFTGMAMCSQSNGLTFESCTSNTCSAGTCTAVRNEPLGCNGNTLMECVSISSPTSPPSTPTSSPTTSPTTPPGHGSSAARVGASSLIYLLVLASAVYTLLF